MTGKRFVVEKYSVRDMSIDKKYVNNSYYIGAGDKGYILDGLKRTLKTITRKIIARITNISKDSKL